jgi:hypothetical protein
VKPDREQLVELGRLADAGQLVPAIDSTFPLDGRGKRSIVSLRVANVGRWCSTSRAASQSGQSFAKSGARCERDG